MPSKTLASLNVPQDSLGDRPKVTNFSRRRALTIGLLTAAGVLFAPLARGKIAKAALPRLPAGLPDSSTDFGFELLLQLAQRESAGPNLAVSPASLMAAFSLVDIGADANMRAALQKTFRLEGREDGDFTAIRRTLAPLIADDPSNGPASGVDAVYVDQDVALNEKAAMAFKALRARIRKRKLADPAVPKEINAFVSDRTKGEIPTIIDGSLEGANLVLINALYFKDNWRSPFDEKETREADFHLFSGGTRRARLMQADTGPFLVAERGEFAAVQLPYETEGYSLIVVVNRRRPARLPEFASVAGWLSGSGLEAQKANILLPRFTVRGGKDVLPALDELGLAPARTLPGAFAGLADSPLQIASVPHKVAIVVDEAGTTAAAATAIAMPTAAPRLPGPVLELVIDKPFMFALRDDKIGLTLMIGYVGDPTDEA